MSYKTGGETEKGGNQYESFALIYYFAKLLNDEIIYVQSESFETELEKGTDIIIKDNNDKIFVVQAKSRAGLEDGWDLTKLNRYSIIENACKHILDGRDFHLLSPLSFTALQDWCRQSKGFEDFHLFEKFIIGKNKNSESSKLFEKVVSKIKSFFGAETPLKFFQHFYVDFLSDNKQFITDYLLSNSKINEPNKAFSLLDHYITKHNKLNQPIFVSEIRNYLKKEGVTFFNIDNQAASLTISDLQDKFINNLGRKLVNQKWIPREEFEKLIDILNNQKVAIISGQSGTGKSALIYNLCNKFRTENKIFLPISFEVNKPNNNLFEYGKSLGFTASPTEVLKHLSNGEVCYLIIDQVDAIKWDQTDWNSAFDACCSLVESCEIIPNLKMVFACRTIDADNILKFWRTSIPKLSDCQLCLSNLNIDSVKSVIPPEKYQNLTQGVRDLLRNAHNLKMYTDICSTRDYVPSNNIIHDYIEIKQKEVQNKGFNTNEIKEFHEYLINELRHNNTTAIPQYKIEDKFNRDLIHAYCSAGIIEITSNNFIKFTHQSILDYYLVKDLISALDAGKSILNIIGQYNSHPLSNLEIIKQFLEACYDREQYLDYLDKIIFCKRIRMVIKNIAIRALKTLKPNDKTNELYIKILKSKYYGLNYLYFLSNGNPFFSSYLINQKEFINLLKSSDYENNLRAVDLLLQANNSYSIKILEEYTQDISDERIFRYLIHNIDDITATDELFNIKIKLLQRNVYKSYYIDWKKLIHGKVKRLAQYLFLYLSIDCFDRDFIYEIQSSTEIENAIKTDYNTFYNLSKKKIEAEFGYELTYDIISQYDHKKKLIAYIFETSLAHLENNELVLWAHSDKLYFKHAALRALINCDFIKGLQIFSSLVNDKFIAQQNYFHDRQLLEIVCNLITKFADKLAEDDFRNLESQIINYKSPSLIDFANERFAQRKAGYFYHYSEEEQKRFLECLPQNKIAEYSKKYLIYLNRKFPSKAYYTWTPEMDQATGFTVVSCIAEKWQTFSIKTWHQIMSNPKTGQKNHGKMVINNKGQAVEATLFEFCSTINTAARAKPKTFIELALNFDDLREPFVEAICEGLYDNNHEDKQVLEQADPQQKLLVYKKYFDITNKKILRSLVWFVERNDLIDSWVFDKLLEIANNSDKYEHDIMNTWSSNWDHNLNSLSIHDLETEKINRVQTCAINCLANTLFSKKTLDENIKIILSKCKENSHPVLLLSAIDILFPVWNFDKDYVVSNLLTVYQNDLRILASTKSLKLLNRAIKNYHKNFYEIFKKVIQENSKEFENVYSIVIAAYCFYGYYDDLVKQIAQNFNNLCLNTCTQILINNTEEDLLNRTRELILSIQDAKQVNKNDIDISYSTIDSKLISDSKNQIIILKAIKSKTFFADTYSEFRFIHEIKGIPKLLPLSKIIITYSKSFLRMKNYRTFEIDELINIIIKLYLEAYEAKKHFLLRKCLNILDKIYSNYIITHDIIV